MHDWPQRSRHARARRRSRGVSHEAVRRLPVTASGPKVLPQPSLVPRSRHQALVATIVLSAMIVVFLLLLSYSVAHFTRVDLLGQIFVGAVIAATLVALGIYVVGLGLYVLPVLLRVRRPAATPPPRWPGIGDRH